MSDLLVRDRWYALIVAGPSGSGKSVVAEEGKAIQDYVVEVVNREFARKGRSQIAT